MADVTGETYEIVPLHPERFPLLFVKWPEGARTSGAMQSVLENEAVFNIDEYIVNPAWHGVLDCYSRGPGAEHWKIDCRHIMAWRKL